MAQRVAVFIAGSQDDRPVGIRRAGQVKPDFELRCGEGVGVGLLDVCVRLHILDEAQVDFDIGNNDGFAREFEGPNADLWYSPIAPQCSECREREQEVQKPAEEERETQC